jgi:DNA-binding LytR/AlgR family response regulator
MEKVKILIVEDEALIAESLREMLESLDYEVTGMAMRAKEALQLIAEEKPDLAILDINLKGVEDGIWLAGKINESYDFPFIFLTSFGNRTTVEQAVKTKPSGYLIKPFKKLDIFSAIEVALQNYAANRTAEPSNTPATPEHSEEGNNIVMKDCIFVKEEYLFKKLVFDKIFFIKSDGNYLEIHTEGKRHVIKSTLRDILPKLPSTKFMQTHRSWVINLEHIESFGANFLNVNKTEIPVGATYKEELHRKLNTH